MTFAISGPWRNTDRNRNLLHPGHGNRLCQLHRKHQRLAHGVPRRRAAGNCHGQRDDHRNGCLTPWLPQIADNETVTVTDSQPFAGGTGSVTDNETVTVTDDSRAWVPIAITLTPAAFNANDGTAIASASYGPVTFTATGGTPPLILTESGTLPAGLTFNNGVLGGTLSSTSTGVYTFSVTAADNYGDTPAVAQGYTLNIGAAPPTPSYKVTANPDAFSVAQGETGTTTLTFTPSGGYTGTLALGCSGLPAYSQCVFTQNGATVNSAYLSGNNQPVDVVLTFETDVNSQLGRLGSAPASTPPGAILAAIAFCWPGSLLGLIAFLRKLRMSPRNQRWIGLCLLVLVTVRCGDRPGRLRRKEQLRHAYHAGWQYNGHCLCNRSLGNRADTEHRHHNHAVGDIRRNLQGQ